MMQTLVRLLVLFVILTIPVLASCVIAQFRGEAPSNSSAPLSHNPVNRS